MLVLGMMSGTSVDGIDASLVRISGAPPNLHIKLLNHTSIAFPAAVRKEILRVAEQNPITSGELSQLHSRLGHIYADAALAACKKFPISPRKIDLIGNHGQTIFHQGGPVPYLAARTASTLQIGEGAIIAARTRIVEGAVGMVEMALKRLADANVVELDPERKAAMVSNLLVVLCGERGAQPVLNAGTLYSA